MSEILAFCVGLIVTEAKINVRLKRTNFGVTHVCCQVSNCVSDKQGFEMI